MLLSETVTIRRDIRKERGGMGLGADWMRFLFLCARRLAFCLPSLMVELAGIEPSLRFLAKDSRRLGHAAP